MMNVYAQVRDIACTPQQILYGTMSGHFHRAAIEPGADLPKAGQAGAEGLSDNEPRHSQPTYSPQTIRRCGTPPIKCAWH
jgi:hypothetical protein